MILIKGSDVRFELSDRGPRPSGARWRWIPSSRGPARSDDPDRWREDDGGWERSALLLALPPSYGMIHDPEGADLEPCVVYFGAFKRGRTHAEMGSSAKKYFGSGYDATHAVVDVPHGPWNLEAEVTQIFYERPGVHAGRYYHEFKTRSGFLTFSGRVFPLDLERCGSSYRVLLPDGCVVNHRGFVTP